MRYYVEINGESSLDIQGLMIQSLPSISKPLMRSKQETIDGRDGDIITKLGYSAYDKTLKIGLWGNYDINEVIAFFNQEGTITFSNEPDKYYRFTILNRDDYVSQLDKFRTCTIALHCQPYKYKLNEEAEELENEYVEQEGTSLTFNNTLVAPMEIDLKGNTSQTGTPTPSSPIPINNVSGDNDIVVCGENLFNASIQSGTYGGATYSVASDGLITQSASDGSAWNISQGRIFYLPAGTYTISIDVKSGAKQYMQLHDIVNDTDVAIASSNSRTFTLTQTTALGFKTYGSGGTYPVSYYVMINKGDTATTYEAYNGTTYNIDLPVPNLFDKNDTTDGKRLQYYQGQAILIDDANYCVSGNISVKPNKTYQVNYEMNAYTRMVFLDSNKQYIDLNQSEQVFTTPSNCAYIRMGVAIANKDTATLANGSVVGTPIELNKIGTYQDYIYKDNDKWYLHKEIQKVVLDGTQTINQVNTTQTNTTRVMYKNIAPNSITDNINLYCNRLTGIVNWNNDVEGLYTNDDSIVFRMNKTTIGTSQSAINTYLTSNNLILYYILATPTNTEITYTPLIEQLESIKNAMSKEGTTNVNQVNNDAPFIITASVLSGTDSITLTNEGNTTSKPTITITGSGVVGVYLENIQMFNISLGTNETIIIDTENMEAYYGSQLKNRQVTGDYSNFALQSGTNNLKFTGLVTNVEITNYNRWI